MTGARKLTIFDWGLIAGVTVCSSALALSDMAKGDGMDWLGITSAITGVFCVVLVAHGNLWNYLFGLVNVTTYAYLSYTSNLLWVCLLNLLYYLPMQFYGFYVWTRRRNV